MKGTKAIDVVAWWSVVEMMIDFDPNLVIYGWKSSTWTSNSTRKILVEDSNEFWEFVTCQKKIQLQKHFDCRDENSLISEIPCHFDGWLPLYQLKAKGGSCPFGMVQPGITGQGSLFTRETWTTGIKDIHGISGVALQISTVCICFILLQLGSWNDDGRILPFGHLLGLETGLILYPCLMCCTQDFTAFVSLEFEPHPNGRAEQARRRQKQRHPEWCRISVINGKGGQIIYVIVSILYDTYWYIILSRADQPLFPLFSYLGAFL